MQVIGGRYQTRDEYVAESRRLRDLLTQLEDTTPNMRDYWPHEDRWQRAMSSHQAAALGIQQQRDDLMTEFQRCRRLAS